MALIKTPSEINKLKRAAQAAQSVYARVLPLLKPGTTEIFIAEKLEKYASALPGYSSLSFPPIVASGTNGAEPHATPTERKFQEGDFITIDFGVTIKGYASDMTRTFILGQATERQLEVYNSVKNAQAAGVAAAKAGISCVALDNVCRDMITADGFGEFFLHTTGHGIGTEVHEDPRIGQNSEEILSAGMVVTIEPGIYIEDWGGVRIEDTVIITETGCEVITPEISKELTGL